MVDRADVPREMASKAKEGEDVQCIMGEKLEVLIRDLVQKFNNEQENLISRNGIVDGYSINRAVGISTRVKRALSGNIVRD